MVKTIYSKQATLGTAGRIMLAVYFLLGISAFFGIGFTLWRSIQVHFDRLDPRTVLALGSMLWFSAYAIRRALTRVRILEYDENGVLGFLDGPLDSQEWKSTALRFDQIVKVTQNFNDELSLLVRHETFLPGHPEEEDVSVKGNDADIGLFLECLKTHKVAVEDCNFMKVDKAHDQSILVLTIGGLVLMFILIGYWATVMQH